MTMIQELDQTNENGEQLYSAHVGGKPVQIVTEDDLVGFPK